MGYSSFVPMGQGEIYIIPELPTLSPSGAMEISPHSLVLLKRYFKFINLKTVSQNFNEQKITFKGLEAAIEI